MEVWISAISLGAVPIVLVILWLADVIRPGSFRRAGARAVSIHPWPVWLCGALLVFLAAPVGARLTAGLAGISPEEAESLRAQGLMAVGSYALAIVVAAFLVRALDGGSPGDGVAARAGLRAGAGDPPRAVLAFVLAYPFVAAASFGAVRLYILLTGHVPETIAHHSLQAIVAGGGDPWAWVLAGAAVVGAPIVEEVIYRVFLTGMLLRLGCPPWPAILACSTLFAFSHYGLVPWHAMIPLGVLGAAMGIAYERTRRLGVPIVMHACFNALNVALAVWLT